MSTNTFADLEARLRDDLPRLADELSSAEVGVVADDDLRRLEPVAVTRPTRRWLVPVAAVAAVALLVIAVVVLRPDHRRDLGPVDVGPAPIDAGWAPMASSPLSPREAAVSVWTGTEVIIWGGRIGNQALLDGAAYNPTTDTWRTITPNSWGHPGASAVWTGTEMVVLAKNGGGAYDPATDSWRDLPRLGDGSGSFIAPVWTGTELLGIGFESDASGLDQRLTAASLVGNQWSTGGSIAVDAGASSVGDRIAWTGSEVVVSDGVGRWWSYDPDTTQWSSLPDLAMPGGELVEVVPAVVDGTTGAVSWLNADGVSILRVAHLDGAGWTWVGDGTPGQLEPKNASPAVAVDGRAIVLGYGAPPWEVDVQSGEIEDVSDEGVGELGNPSVASTGTEVVVWGGLDPAGRATAAGWRWRPGG